jgi:peptidylprolyl isomerase
MRLALSACLLALPLALPAQARDTDQVARMGGSSLSLAEVRQLAESLPAEARSPQALERLARTEVIRKHVAGEARRQGFERKPEVAALMERAAEQVLVTAYMNSLARPPADYPGDDLVRQAYENNKAAFSRPAQYRVSQIYVVGTDAKAARQAEELHRQATRKGADFAEIARKSSQHKASADKGGDMGWLAEGDLLPAIRAALGGMKKGEVAAPVAGGEGFHIVRLADRKDAEPLSLDQVKPTLVQQLRLRKAQELEAAYLEGLLAKSPLAVNGILLGELAKGAQR